MSDYASISEFVIAIERTWEPYLRYIRSLSPEQLDGPTDNRGWTVKDHIAHVTSWQEGITAVLQGRPRHEGMGVAEADMDFDDIDTLNEKMRQVDAHFSGPEAVNEAVMKHEGFIMELEAQPEDAVRRTRGDYLPGQEGSEMPFTEWVWNNSGGHYGEHLTYIRRILNDEV